MNAVSTANRRLLSQKPCCVPVVLIVVLGFSLFASAQTLTVLHNFTYGQDGAYPYAGLTTGGAGTFYGTTSGGGSYNNCHFGCGGVFRLRAGGTGWVVTPLYVFQGPDGASPYARVTVGGDGSLYGTTVSGGGVSCSGNGCGTVFNVRPPASTICTGVLCMWMEAVLHSFDGGPDGGTPKSEVMFDQEGNLYGTTEFGGCCIEPTGAGVIYKMSFSNRSWVQSLLYTFMDAQDGEYPSSGLLRDAAGNLYGTTPGTIYQLSPSGMLTNLHVFHGGNDGSGPTGLVADRFGNLYGATITGGPNGGGTVFELAPANGGWDYRQIFAFSGNAYSGPAANLFVDAAGAIYGTTTNGGTNSFGTVFRLTSANGIWSQTVLHTFTGGAEGGIPMSNVVIDSNGNLFGTAAGGGAQGAGVIWEIVP
jgi:uncharacterized repeat protein (TIGR03803 family)